jgi:hypothetical protein
MEDYGFEYSDEEVEEADVDIENQYYNSKGLIPSLPLPRPLAIDPLACFEYGCVPREPDLPLQSPLAHPHFIVV